ncbi:uroporphyrinogen-III C-methyltransferase, partial [Diaphorobacter nitroreducens]
GEATAPAPAASTASQPRWQATLHRTWEGVRDEVRGLVRVSRIDHPDAILLAPDQAFFLRENLKLKLLNARLGLLARRMDSARADLAGAYSALGKYFDPASRRTQNATAALQQLQAHMKTVEMPALEDTFAALATAAAGR